MERINKSLLKRIESKSDKDLLEIANAFKVANRVYTGTKFWTNYDTILFELKRRNLLKED